MRSVALCAVLFGLATEVAAAQGTPVTFEEPQPVTVGGFAVGSANYDRAGGTNSFSADKISVTLFKPAGDVYFYGQLTTALPSSNDPTNPTGTPGIDIDHLFVAWTPSATPLWSFEFGRLAAPIGFEQDDEPLNLIATFSFNFRYARPSAFTGALARFTPLSNLGFVAAVANGSGAEETAINRGKTGYLRAEWIAADGLTIGVSGLYGPPDTSTAAFQRTLIAPDITLQRGPFIIATELNLGHQANGAGGTDRWAGGTLTAFVELSSKLGLAARYDALDDAKGIVTGTQQVMSSFTIGPMLHFSSSHLMLSNIEKTTFHIPQIEVRAALRVDYSTQPFFPNGQSRDTEGIIQVLYVF